MTVGRHRPPQAGATRGIGWELAELERSISDRFARVTGEEIGHVLGLSRQTVQEEWKVAKMWLRHQLAGGEGS